MDCPICNKKEIDPLVDKCPQCDSDLSVLKNFKELKSISIIGTSKILSIIGYPILLILIILLIIYDNQAVLSLKTENKFLRDSLSNKPTILEVTHDKTAPPLEINYVVKKNDSLWKIAKYFYNNGRQYSKIVSYNNLQSLQLVEGQVIKIKFE